VCLRAAHYPAGRLRSVTQRRTNLANRLSFPSAVSSW
jgi:hypothetical protein